VDELDSADEADELAEQKAAQMSAPRKVTIKEPEESDDDFVEVGKKGKAMHTSDVNVFDKLEAVLDARGKKVLFFSLFIALEHR
jgi:hypothetical protein